MAALTHFVKTDTTARTTSSTTAVELTNYTVSWADLTGAGFAAGDDVLILVAVKSWNSSANNNTFFAVGFGTTFAGRTEDATSVQRAEPIGTANGDQYLWFDRRTLVTNENIYFRGNGTAGTSSYNELVVWIIKLDDLDSTDFLYNEASHSASDDSWTAYVSGATANTPAAGDWLVLARTRVAIEETPGLRWLAIHDGTSDISEIKTDGEDAADFRVMGTMAYKAGLGSGVALTARYRADDTRTTDFESTAIFGLRLDAFEDHAGVQAASTINLTPADTYLEFAGFGSFGLTTTGPLVAIGWPICALSATTKRPYGRIQIGGSDWPAANANRVAIGDNGSAVDVQVAPFLFGYAASQSSGTLDIDLDAAEDAAAPTVCEVQVAVVFSLTLAGAGGVAGDGAALLQAIEASADGQLLYAGQAAATLGGIGATASAAMVPIGAAAATLGAIAATAAAQLMIPGAGAAVLQSARASGAALLVLPGAGAATLPSIEAAAQAWMVPIGDAAALLGHLTAQASGQVVVTGAGAAVLGAILAASVGIAAARGAGAALLPGVLAAGSGALRIPGAAAATLPAIVALSSGELVLLGSGAATLAGIQAAAQAIAEVRGAGAATLQHVMASAAAQQAFVAQAAASLQAIGLAATGIVSADGAGAMTLAAVLGQATGQIVYTGAASAQLQAVLAAASGEFFDEVIGAGDARLPALLAQAQAIAEVVGSSAALLPHVRADAAGHVEVPGATGAAALTLPSLAMAAAGELVFAGQVAAALQPVAGAAAGTLVLPGAGGAILASVRVTADAALLLRGAGAAILPIIAAQLSGAYVPAGAEALIDVVELQGRIVLRVSIQGSRIGGIGLQATRAGPAAMSATRAASADLGTAHRRARADITGLG